MYPDYKTRHKQNKANATIRNQAKVKGLYQTIAIPRGKKERKKGKLITIRHWSMLIDKQ
jgi:hypothetical protein